MHVVTVTYADRVQTKAFNVGHAAHVYAARVARWDDNAVDVEVRETGPKREWYSVLGRDPQD